MHHLIAILFLLPFLAALALPSKIGTSDSCSVATDCASCANITGCSYCLDGAGLCQHHAKNCTSVAPHSCKCLPFGTTCTTCEECVSQGAYWCSAYGTCWESNSGPAGCGYQCGGECFHGSC